MTNKYKIFKYINVLLLVAATMLCAGALVACGGSNNSSASSVTSQATSESVSEATETESTIKFGVGYKTDFGADYYGNYLMTTTVFAVAMDNQGKVIDARGDVTQMKFVAAAGETEGTYTVSIASGDKSGDKSKVELGADYAMKGNSEIGKEFYEQIEAWSDWTVGKTAAEVADADKVTGCSVGTGDFQFAFADAVAKAYEVTTSASAIKAGVGMVNGGLRDGEASLYIAGAITGADKVVSSYVDCVVCVPSSTDGTKIVINTASYGAANKYYANAATGQAVKSKRDLGDAYGMKGSSELGKEYFEQCASMDAFFTGKTLTEAAAVGNDATVTGVSISAGGLINVSKEAIDYSTKDVITNKPVAA